PEMRDIPATVHRPTVEHITEIAPKPEEVISVPSEQLTPMKEEREKQSEEPNISSPTTETVEETRPIGHEPAVEDARKVAEIAEKSSDIPHYSPSEEARTTVTTATTEEEKQEHSKDIPKEVLTQPKETTVGTETP